ncbi:MAG TPA: hypothetical protein P5160_01685 [Candidatus Omnitrophota bacterium]|nr:hypothetical protein [Candidatus Omnitrophota bacterium]
MNIQWRSKRLWGYILIIAVYALAVKIQQLLITSRRQASIISTVDEWARQGKPVEAQKLSRRDVKQYLKITVLATGEDLLYEGFVSKSVQQKLSQGQDLYWVRQDGRLEAGDPVPGKVLLVAEEPDMANGMYRVRVRFERAIEQEAKMAVARVHYETIKSAINVPVESLDAAGEHYYGWRIENGRARQVEVTVDQRNGYGAIVTEGLKEGDLFVTAGQTFLKNNDPVNIVQNKE